MRYNAYEFAGPKHSLVCLFSIMVCGNPQPKFTNDLLNMICLNFSLMTENFAKSKTNLS